MDRLIIRSRRVVTPEIIGPACVHVRNGIIVALGAWDEAVEPAVPFVDAGDAVVMPGLVDSHVHVNEPGRTQWEGFATATRAGAAGGVTTLVDMPLNSIPPTTTADGLAAKLTAANGQCWIDVAFWGGVIPGNTNELKPLLDAGVRGFKCFLVPSGVDEFPHVTAAGLRIAMPEIARLDTVLLVHAELSEPIDEAARSLVGRDSRSYETFLHSRPRSAEDRAIEMMIGLCRETKARVHIVHLSSSDALPKLREAKAEGLPITAETCPHYLTFVAETIVDGATHFKCCPPVREGENREKLWDALRDGTIDMVVSDHSPCTPDLKLQEKGDFLEAWGGISALQFALPATWTSLKDRGFDLTDLTRLMCEHTAKLAGLDDRKGKLAVGFDADIVVWDPDERFTVAPEQILHRHKLTPYTGMELFGKVAATYVRGRCVYENEGFANTIAGQLLV